MDIMTNEEWAELVREQQALIKRLDEEIVSLKGRADQLADLHVAEVVAGTAVASVESLETSESEARPLSTEQLAVALGAQGKLTEVYRDIAMAQAASPVAATSEPFMYAIMEPSGAPYMDEFCVASNAEDLYSTLNGLNDSPDTGYTVVPVYLSAPQQHVQAALSADQIEELMPENEGNNGAYPCDKCGWIQVSAQWLHDFANNVHCTTRQSAPVMDASTAAGFRIDQGHVAPVAAAAQGDTFCMACDGHGARETDPGEWSECLICKGTGIALTNQGD